MKLKTAHIKYIVFGALVVYFSLGFFHLSYLEGDGINIATSIDEYLRSGLKYHENFYRYDFQPGTYYLVIPFAYLFSADTFQVFSIITSIACIIAIFFAILIARNITKQSIIVCGFVLFLLPESFISGYYPNSNVLSAAFLFPAIYFLTLRPIKEKRVLISGLLFAFAVWIRFDGLLLFPLLFVLLLEDGRINNKIFIQGLILLVTVIALYSLLAIVSKIDIQRLFREISLHKILAFNSTFPKTEYRFFESIFIKNHIVFFTLAAIFLLICGIIFIFRKKEWKTLMLFLAGILPFYIAFQGSITTPKYFYMLIPVFLIIMLKGIKMIYSSYIQLRTFFYLLVFCQFVLGLKLNLNTRPYVDEDYSILKAKPVILPIFNRDLNHQIFNKISLRIGAGSSAGTADGPRLTSGLMFIPLTWSFNSDMKYHEIKKLNYFLNSTHNDSIFFVVNDYYGHSLVLNILVKNDYKIIESASNENITIMKFQLKKNCVFLCLKSPQVNPDIIFLNGLINKESNIVFVSSIESEIYRFLQMHQDYKPINNFAFQIKASKLRI